MFRLDTSGMNAPPWYESRPQAVAGCSPGYIGFIEWGRRGRAEYMQWKAFEESYGTVVDVWWRFRERFEKTRDDYFHSLLFDGCGRGPAKLSMTRRQSKRAKKLKLTGGNP